MKKLYSVLTLSLLLFISQEYSGLTYHLQAGGNPLLAANWGTNAAGTAGAPAQFSGSHTWNLGTNNTAITLSATWTVATTATVNIGDGTNPFNLTLSAASATIGVSGTQSRLNVNNNATLTLAANIVLNSATNKTVLNNGSTVVFGTGAGNVYGVTLPYYNLNIDASNSLNGNSIIINNDLTINSAFDLSGGSVDVTNSIILNADLTMSGGLVTLAGTIAGSGKFDGDNIGSSFVFTGTGNIGTFNLLSPFIISSLDINLATAASSLTLGNNLIIDGGALLTSAGILNLNGNNLRVDAGSAVDFSGGGTISANGTEVINIVAGGGITGAMNMDATNNTLRGLILNSTGNTLQLANALNINDSLIVTDGTFDSNGNLTLTANGTRTARIGQMGAGGAITGNVTVQTFAPAGNTGWTTLGVSGVNGQLVSNWDGQIPMTCENCIYSVTGLGSYFESIQGWDETQPVLANGYDTTITSATPLSIGRGFWVYLGNGVSATTDMTWNVTGTINQGAGQIAVTDGGNQFNLIANPYPCPISWNKLLAINTNGVFLSDEIHTANPDLPGFMTSYVSGASTPAGAPTGANDVIASGQGFFVLANSTFNVDYDETIKVDNNTSANPLLRSANNQKPYYGDMFRLTLTGSNDWDAMVFRVHPAATALFDKKWDAHKMFSSPGYVGYPGSYSKYTSLSAKDAQGVDYSIISFPPSNQSFAVPVMARASTSGNYTISAGDYQGYTGCVILRDKLNNSYHDLRKANYVCFISDTTNSARFELVFCENSVAPLSVADLNTASTILVSQDINGVFVKTSFETKTKATISAYNLIGQQLINDIVIEGTDNYTPLNINASNQVILVRITTDKETVTKKILVK